MGNTLIIGGAGFIGANLARRAVSRGERPHIAVGPNTDLWRLRDINDKVVTHRFEFGDLDAAQKCMREAGPERVYYLAARTRGANENPIARSRQLITEDATNLLTFIEAAANAPTPPKHFIRAGSLAEYGAAATPYREQDRDRPLTLYGAALAGGTMVLNVLKPNLPFNAVSIRLALTYGPMQSTSFLIPNLIDRVGRGLGVHIQNPDARRDLIYVGDVADAIETLDLRLPDDIDCLNICTGDAPTMRDVANLVIEAHGADPGLVTYGNNATRDGALQFSGSTDLAFSVLAWKPQISLREGIERTVSEWKARNDD